jgi:Mg2+-importing ATPase
VVEGRKVFANIVKYIPMGASSNFGSMFNEGRAKLRRILERAHLARVTPSLTLPSPTAALETAKIAARELGLRQ